MAQPHPIAQVPLSQADEARVRGVVEAHYDFLWRSLRRLGVAPDAVEDAAHEVLLVLMRRVGDVQAGAERAFLFGTALRVAADARKKGARLVASETLDERRDPAPDPEQALDERQARALLDRVLETLPLELRTVLMLADLEELTMAAIAELLALPPGTVASRLRRARELFQAEAGALKARLTGGAPRGSEA